MSQKTIFICVAKDSYEIVPQIEKFYETPTNSSFFSLWSASNHKNLSGSTNYEKEIKKQLKNSDGAILLISKGSLKKDGFIPEDVNVGISGQVLSNFLNMPIKANLNESENYDASQIYEYMRPSVVFIVSQ